MSVTEPGLYPDLSNADYHEETDWWGSSQLKAALPERYKEGGNQEAFDFGSLFHTVVLEPDRLDQYVALDAETIGVKSDGTRATNPTMTSAWKRAIAEANQDGKTIVAQTDWDKAHAMADAIKAHPTAVELLHQHDGSNEESAFWIDPDTGLRHKARFDRRIPGAIIDLKSTSAKPGTFSLRRAARDYGYHFSACHYLTVAHGLGLDVEAFALCFVGKQEPFYVTVAEISPALLAEGAEQRDMALSRLTDPSVERYEGARGYITL